MFLRTVPFKKARSAVPWSGLKIIFDAMLHIVHESCYTCVNLTEINMATKPKTKFLTVRLEPPAHKAFHRKATEYGGVSEVLRELIAAFVENRVTVIPNPERKSIYHVPRNQN